MLPSLSLDWVGIGYAVASGALASGLGYALWYTTLLALQATQAATLQLVVVKEGGTPPCYELKEMVSDRMDKLDQKIAELQTLRQDLAAYQAELTRQLVDAAVPPPASLCNGTICGCIEQISDEA